MLYQPLSNAMIRLISENQNFLGFAGPDGYQDSLIGRLLQVYPDNYRDSILGSVRS
jgi:hypothetical protein